MKQERYKKEDGTDTIDKWNARLDAETFRELMWCQMEKYKDRLGKKDEIWEEVGKIADYARRWHEKELEKIPPDKIEVRGRTSTRN